LFLISSSGSIGDQCETFVDQYGQAVIDALVNDELSPKQVIVTFYSAKNAKNNVFSWGLAFK
jgi:hypothetical protein